MQKCEIKMKKSNLLQLLQKTKGGDTEKIKGDDQKWIPEIQLQNKAIISALKYH